MGMKYRSGLNQQPHKLNSKFAYRQGENRSLQNNEGVQFQINEMHSHLEANNTKI